jgi:hypothetical protein
MSHELTIETQPDGKKHRVTVRQGGEVLAVDTVNLLQEKDRERFTKSLTEKYTGVEEDAIAKLLLDKAAAASAPPQQSTPAAVDPLETTPAEIRDEAEELLQDPNLMKRICDDIALVGVAGERTLTATLYLVGTSRLLGKPLSAIVRGSSSSGKSYTLEALASLFPPEAVIHAQQMTPQALFHMEPGSLVHKWIVAGERSRLENDDRAEATRALREMISSGRLSKLMPMKVGGEIVTELIAQEGPIAFCETTTLGEIFNEDANRCILLQTDESQAQTERITRAIAERHTLPKTDVELIRDVHHCIQRLIPEGASVAIPYAGKLQEHFPHERVEVRRAFPQLLQMIQAIALLHFRQRKLDSDGRIIAEARDYQLAFRLLAEPFSQSLGGRPSMAALDFWAELPTDGSFVVKLEATRQKKSPSSAKGWMRQLEDSGMVVVDEPNKGSKAATWRRVADTPSFKRLLPSPETVFPSLATERT